MNRLEELTLKLVDGEITDEEARELDELTQSTDARDSFLRLMKVESHLLSAGRGTCADRVVDDLRLQRCQRIEDGVMSAVVGGLDETNEFVGNAKPAIATKLGSRVLLSFASVAVLAIMIGIAVWLRSGEKFAPVLAELVASESSVVVRNEVSHTIQTLTDANQSISLRAGQSVETPRSMDSAEIVYADGTRIELLGNTKVTLSSTENKAKQLTVVSGMIQADVAPQPAGRPLKIVTSTATLEVLGTTLGVEVHTDSTQLEVASGLVAITRNVDDQRVDVSEGHFVRATGSKNDAFEATPFPAIPSDWATDLSSGLPAGWSGKVVETESGFGVEAAANEARQRNFSITTQNAWQLGEHALFQVHDDSVLHIRFQQSEFARITVMVGTRAFPPEKGQFGANLFYTKKEWNENLAAGHWKLISIPLREVGWHIRRRVKQGGAPDLNGLAAYLIQVTTMERDAGLTVDRMWVTGAKANKAQVLNSANSIANSIAQAESLRPNIVVIMADDLGYQDLGCYGSKIHNTPNIDALAAGGMRFSDFYVTTSVCTPTRAAFLTGRFPQRCKSPGVLWPTSTADALPQDEITLPEILQEVGYTTHLSGKWHLGHGEPEHLPLGHGFHSWYGMPYPNDMGPGHPQEEYRQEEWPEMPMMLNNEIVEQPVDVNLLTQQYTSDAVNFIAKNHRKPFFLLLAHAMPHAIIGASPDFRLKSKNGLYGAAVEELDWSTGEILRSLRAFGLERNTLVIFTNDNGGVTAESYDGKNLRWFWPDGSHGSNAPLRGGKQATFEGGVRVPGIFYWPTRVKEGIVKKTPANIVDIFPTVLDYLTLAPPEERVIDGRTLKEVLEGKGEREESTFYFGGSGSVTGARSGKWKLQFPTQPRWMLPRLESDQPLLFDLSSDIGENANVADQHPDVVAKLMSNVDAYKKEVGLKPSASTEQEHRSGGLLK